MICGEGRWWLGPAERRLLGRTRVMTSYPTRLWRALAFVHGLEGRATLGAHGGGVVAHHLTGRGCARAEHSGRHDRANAAVDEGCETGFAVSRIKP